MEGSERLGNLQRQRALRVPLEIVSRYFRLRQKLVEKELGCIAADVRAGRVRTSDAAAWAAVRARLLALKAQSQAWLDAEKAAVAMLQRRLAALREGRRSFDTDAAIVEWLAFLGATSTAARVHAALAPPSQLLCDLQPMEEIEAAASALGARSLAPALTWVQQNGSRLRRIGSPLDFAVRKMQFVELVRARDLTAALAHASEYLAPAAKAAAAAGASSTAAVSLPPGDGSILPRGTAAPPPPLPPGTDCMLELQRVMSMLAFPDPPHCGVPEIEALFADAAWQALRRLFRTESRRALGYAPAPELSIALSLGITAMKTHTCHAVATVVAAAAAASSAGSARPPLFLPPPATNEAGVACPACSRYFAERTMRVPGLHRSTTTLLCPISREVMSDANPPVALPNGHVYGSNTLRLVTSEDKTKVLCPLSGAVFGTEEVRKVYIL